MKTKTLLTPFVLCVSLLLILPSFTQAQTDRRMKRLKRYVPPPVRDSRTVNSAELDRRIVKAAGTLNRMGGLIRELNVRDARVDDVIAHLSELSVQLDPEKEGVNMVALIKPRKVVAAPDTDPFGQDNFGKDDPFGLRKPEAPKQTVRTEIPRITMSLRRVTLYDALRHICQAADLKFHIDGNIVVITDRNDVRGMVTRTYPVHRPDTFNKALKQRPAKDPFDF